MPKLLSNEPGQLPWEEKLLDQTEEWSKAIENLTRGTNVHAAEAHDRAMMYVNKDKPKHSPAMTPDEAMALFMAKPAAPPALMEEAPMEAPALPQAPVMRDSLVKADSAPAPKAALAQVAQAESAQAPVAPVSPLDALLGSLYDDKALTAAQDKRDQGVLLAQLGKAANTIGAALGGSDAKPFNAILDDVQKTAGMDIEKIKEKRGSKLEEMKFISAAQELQDSQKLSDPKSEISQYVRDALKKKGYKVPDGTSAKDLKALGLDIGGLVKAEARNYQFLTVEGPDGRPMLALGDPKTGTITPTDLTRGYGNFIKNQETGEWMSRSGKTIQGGSGAPLVAGGGEHTGESRPLKLFDLAPRHQNEVLKLNKQLRSETKDILAAKDSAKNVLSMINSDVAVPRMIATTFARTVEKGVLTESDVSQYGGMQDLMSKVNRTMALWTQGKLTEGDKKFLSGLAKKIEANTNENLTGRAGYYADQISQLVPNVKKSDAMSLLSFDQYVPDQAQSSNRKVVKKLFSPSRNKTKIMYSDGSVDFVDGEQ